MKQYPEDFYEDSGLLIGKFCQKTIAFDQLSTINDHLTSNKHVNVKIKAKKELSSSKGQPASKRQTTFFTAVSNATTAEEL